MEALKALIPSEYYVPVLALVIVIVLLTLALLNLRWRIQRPNFVLGIVIAILLLVVMRADMADRWSWMLGLLPTLLVAYQAFYLWLSQPTEMKRKSGPEDQDLKTAHRRAQKSIDSQYGIKTLFIRYGFPAALLAIIGIVVLNVLIKPGSFLSLVTLLNSDVGRGIVKIDWHTAEKALLGLRLGALGAYVYVLLELGRRTFRHDVTGTSAMWCLVTLILGPILAATVAVLWRIQAPDPTGSNWWAGGVVLFFAGYAPRRVIAAIEQAAVQLLKLGGSSAVVPTRQVPLTQIRGISPQIEERLSEEGIDDVNALASAEPIRLLRNTSFDLRQILTWIDEAILMVTLPRSWQALEEEGITGAIDLAWLAYTIAPVPEMSPEEAATHKEENTEFLRALAEKAKITPASLMATIYRLQQDRQVQDIWVLYNSFTESSEGAGTGDGNNGEGQPVAADAVQGNKEPG